ncbi:MAG: O-antigen ligase family protein [Actinomycetota bacterium]
MSVIESVRRAPFAPMLVRLRELVLWLGVAAVSAAFGFALAFITSPFEESSPYLMIALPLVPLAIVAVMVDPIVAPMIVAASFPFGSANAFGIQVAEAAALATGALVVVRRIAVGQSPLPFARPLIWPVLLLGWTLVALFSAIDNTLAVKQVVGLVGGILVAITVLASCRDLHRLRILLGFLTLIGLIMALTSLSSNHQLKAVHGGSDVENRVRGAFESPNQLGSWCALVIPIAAGLMFLSSRRLARVLGAVALLALLATLMFSLSRSAWIGTGAALVLMVLTLREARRLLAFIFVPLAVIGYLIFSTGAAPPEVKVVGERVQKIGVRSPYDARSQIYNEALREIREDPVTGVGPGGFVVSSRRAGTETSSVAADHAHNLLLNYGAESGLPAVALVLAFVFSLAAAAHRGIRAVAQVDLRHRGLILSVGAALFAIFVQGFFDYTLGNPVIRITVWMLIGALLVAVREADRAQLQARPVRARRGTV